MGRLIQFSPASRTKLKGYLPWIAIIVLQAAGVMTYLNHSGATVEQVRYVLYPFIWINVGIWAVLRVQPFSQPLRIRGAVAILAAGYFVLLLVLPGKVGFATEGPQAGLSMSWAIPGWGPMLAYSGEVFRFHLIPFVVIGYAALSYLVYSNLLRLTRTSLAGAIGIVTCVGCTVPLAIPLLGMLGGTGTTLASTAYSWSYDVGTGVFVLVVLFLLRGVSDTTS